jgi:pyridoxal phosphate enzyme (YggS family)
VNAELSVLSARLNEVRERLRSAAERSGRPAESVRLVGITKTVPLAVIEVVMGLGLRDLGENRVQEAEAKIAGARDASEGGSRRWHLVGHLQKNKAKRAAQIFDRVHSVDSIELAAALARHAGAEGRVLPVMIEVNVARVPAQFGVAPEALAKLAGEVARMPGLALDGLMTVGPPTERADGARPTFAALRALRDRVEQETGVKLPELSMGMSADFEVAIEEGSTMIRVGSALFGPRK